MSMKIYANLSKSPSSTKNRILSRVNLKSFGQIVSTFLSFESLNLFDFRLAWIVFLFGDDRLINDLFIYGEAKCLTLL